MDTTIAHAITRSRALDPFIQVLELITLKSVSDFLLPLVLLVCGAALWASKRAWQARAAVYVGLVQLASYVASDLSKPLFGRLRPSEALERGIADTWFVGANSFPSGHVAYFAGLTVPIVVLCPRSWPLLTIPVVVATQRVLSASHYVSDVAASCGLAVAAALLLAPLLRAKERDTTR